MKTGVHISFVARKIEHVALRTPSTCVIIACRVTIGGGRAQFNTPHETILGKWEPANGQGRIKGTTTATKAVNASLVQLRAELTALYEKLTTEGQHVTAKQLLAAYQPTTKAERATLLGRPLPKNTISLAELLKRFIAEQQSLEGIEIAASTLRGYRARLASVQEFLKAERSAALLAKDFTQNLGDALLHWLLTKKQSARNSALKKVQLISQALRWGVRRELLDSNPLDLYRYKFSAPKDIIYLTSEELGYLSKMPLASKSLQRVRDAFVLQCWTGLAYADLAALDIAKSTETLADGRRLLQIKRAKSTVHKGYECVIPLLPEAERILALYSDKVPVCNNGAFNKCLKQIGEFAGLGSEKMTSHVGRKTAGVLMLNAGIRMETVSKFLGHASVRMTERAYAKILNRTVADEFGRVFAPSTPAPAPVTTGKVLQMWGSVA